MLAVSRVGASWYAAVVGKVSSSVLGSNRATGCAVGQVLTIGLVELKLFVIFSSCKLWDTSASFNALASSFILFPFLSCKSCKEEVMKSWEAPCF